MLFSPFITPCVLLVEYSYHRYEAGSFYSSVERRAWSGSSRANCEAHCDIDDDCEGYHYNNQTQECAILDSINPALHISAGIQAGLKLGV